MPLFSQQFKNRNSVVLRNVMEILISRNYKSSIITLHVLMFIVICEFLQAFMSIVCRSSTTLMSKSRVTRKERSETKKIPGSQQGKRRQKTNKRLSLSAHNNLSSTMTHCERLFCHFHCSRHMLVIWSCFGQTICLLTLVDL